MDDFATKQLDHLSFFTVRVRHVSSRCEHKVQSQSVLRPFRWSDMRRAGGGGPEGEARGGVGGGVRVRGEGTLRASAMQLDLPRE